MRVLDDVVQDPLALLTAPVGRVREVLDALEGTTARARSPPFVRLPADRPVLVLGDTHGDVASIQRVFERATSAGTAPRVVALGDYLDRATRREPRPTVLPTGSLFGFLHLLARRALDPDGVVLLQGNHEAQRRLPVPGPTFLRELRELYPPEAALEVWDRVLRLAESLPLAAATENGVFLAHGGIPPPDRYDPAGWDPADLRLLEGLLWSDPALDYADRGVGFAFGEPELKEFLSGIGCAVFVRGHDPEHLGTALYDGRLVTLQTSDIFARIGRGGILLAEIPARRSVRSAADLSVVALRDEGWVPYALAPSVDA